LEELMNRAGQVKFQEQCSRPGVWYMKRRLLELVPLVFGY
jgi:hypothetical protein